MTEQRIAQSELPSQATIGSHGGQASFTVEEVYKTLFWLRPMRAVRQQDISLRSWTGARAWGIVAGLLELMEANGLEFATFAETLANWLQLRRTSLLTFAQVKPVLELFSSLSTLLPSRLRLISPATETSASLVASVADTLRIVSWGRSHDIRLPARSKLQTSWD